jgi:Ca2+-binding RTX toxin-like protein
MKTEQHIVKIKSTSLMVIAVVSLLMIFSSIASAEAAFKFGYFFRPNVIVGLDNDNIDNPEIQPSPGDPNQSLNNTDILIGGFRDDILIGLLGSDVMHGWFGNDVLIGGTEQGSTPNSDIMFGDNGDDISIWAPGDGSEAFDGGHGEDVEIFGVIDRDADNVPTLDAVTGLPTAEVTGSGGFCTIEPVQDPDLGFEFLARFFVRATGNLAVTVRLKGVEQVFCTSEAGGEITFADLTAPDPQFEVISLEDVENLNPRVAKIIR